MDWKIIVRFAQLKGLSRKLTIGIASLLFTIILIMGLVIYLSTRSNIKSRFERDLQNTNNLIHDMTVSSVNTSIRAHLNTIADKNRELVNHYYQLYKKGEMGYDGAIDSIRRIFLSPAYSRIGSTGYLAIISGYARTVVHPKLKTGYDMSGFDFMQKAVAMKDGYLEYKWKNPDETGEREKVAALAYFRPWDFIIWAGSYKNEFTDLVDIQELKKHISDIKIGRYGYPYVLDLDGKLIIHRELEGQNIADWRDASGRYIIKEMIEKKNGFIQYDWKNPSDLVPRAKLVYYKFIPEMNWIVASGIYYDELSEQLSGIRYIIIITLFVSFIVTVFFVTWLVSKILRPLREIKAVSDRVSEGYLDRSVEYISDDEIGEMSRHFNRIVKNFSEVLIKIKKTADLLTASIQDLNVTTREVSTTANQQAAAVKEMVSTMEDSDALSKKVASRIDEVAKIARSTKEFVEKGFTIIKGNSDKMNQIQNTNSETITGIKSLGEQIESVWEVVNIINGIADQTKIIAFNAELEASAAGESGRNFQIVASEVRRLADNTFSSTAEIKARIEEIQRSSDNLVLASEKGTERIREGAESTRKLGDIFADILNTAETSASSSEQIVSSVNQQVAAFEQILLTLKQISSGIDDFTASTKSTTGAAESLKNMGRELGEILGKYRT
jgi:methyl-accepting chemotaxis protein